MTGPLPTGDVVVAEDLTRRFGEILAVDRLSLRVKSGQIFGLLGPNGAGKSTTIKMLTTLLEPSAGTASVAGFDIRSQPRRVRGRIGYVPQLVSADGALTAYENLNLSARLYGISSRQRKARIAEGLEFMGLSEHGGRLVKTFSGGMIRRLELAQALLHRPDLLFLDEPTIGLDPMARRTVWDKLKELRRSLNLTVLITTHDMEEADQLCDELAIMLDGRVMARGESAALKAGLGQAATLNDVFAAACGGVIRESGDYRGVGQRRRTASQLG
ncbi:MAG: ATP-binding cassette domain-containing protein [Elusimicrobia bacterium]|nr:ATP-binding cassette domain-containing protein [Elusimicrobiota bacterium]MDE2237647.1 ATP-binding cassette domain-containing protein [Elusimicrobiota bacterium]MDE2425960.1 ATP-binding cassette domain-containing protein [Elusimicrobiota bacterium]